jgi:hypothetical protein
VTETKKTPPDAYSAFKAFLEKLVKVPKSEIDEKEAEYQDQRKAIRKRRA